MLGSVDRGTSGECRALGDCRDIDSGSGDRTSRLMIEPSRTPSSERVKTRPSPSSCSSASDHRYESIRCVMDGRTRSRLGRLRTGPKRGVTRPAPSTAMPLSSRSLPGPSCSQRSYVTGRVSLHQLSLPVGISAVRQRTAL